MAVVDRLEDVLDTLMGMRFPPETWESEILPVRIAGFAPAMLDGVCASGHRVWVGGGAVGAGEIEVSFWPRHLLATRPVAPDERAEIPEAARRVRDFLKANGASFFFDMQVDLSMDDGDLALGLRALAQAGEISSDQLDSLREVQRIAANARRDRSRAPFEPRLHATHARHVPRPSRMPRNWWKSARHHRRQSRRPLVPIAAAPGARHRLGNRRACRRSRRPPAPPHRLRLPGIARTPNRRQLARRLRRAHAHGMGRHRPPRLFRRWHRRFPIRPARRRTFR